MEERLKDTHGKEVTFSKEEGKGNGVLGNMFPVFKNISIYFMCMHMCVQVPVNPRRQVGPLELELEGFEF